MHALTIVVATDGSLGALKAASWVDDTFAGTDVAVHLVSLAGVSSFDDEARAHGLVYDPSWPAETAVWSAWTRAKRRADEALHHTAHLLAKIQNVTETVLEGANPARAIIQFARDRQAGLIVMGRHGHSQLGSPMGSVSFSVIQQSPIPVTVIAAHPLLDDLTNKVKG